MKHREIQRAVARECLAMNTESKKQILDAYTSYCVALKQDDQKVPLWTSSGAVMGVYREIEKLRKNYSSNLEGFKHPASGF